MDFSPVRLEQFWRRVVLHKADQCWRWVGAKDPLGYGHFGLGTMKQWIYAHRFSCQLEHGEIPEGLIVRHSCDNPGCVNPRHLLVGTQRDNMRDMYERGRARPHGKTYPATA
jgi:hypothetical protein